jgi:hypothetical protein
MNHTEAANIVREQWEKVVGRPATKPEILFTMAVAWLETQYGRVGQHGKLAEQGKYNWANVERPREGDTCPEGWAAGIDWEEKGGNRPVCFRVFASDAEAAAELIRNLAKRHWPVVKAIADEGTPEAVAHAMKVAPAYYTGDEALYAKFLRNAIVTIGKGLEAEQSGVTLPIAQASKPPSSSIGLQLMIGGIIGVVAVRRFVVGAARVKQS